MIDATSALDLVEVEGDAAFMYRPLPGGTGPELVESALGQSVAMHGAFHALQQKIACLNNCQIGRASCRERVLISVGAVSLKKNGSNKLNRSRKARVSY